MKAIIRTIALLAMSAALALAYSCSKESTDTQSFKKTQYSSDEAKYTFSGNSWRIRSVELTGDGTAIIIREKDNHLKATLEEQGLEVVITTYEVKAQGVYDIAGFGTMQVDRSAGTAKVQVSAEYAASQGVDEPQADELSIEVEVQEEEKVEAGESFLSKLCRSWKIERTVLGVKGGDLPSNITVGRLFNGGNIDEMAQYLRNNGVKFDADIEGYNVEKVTFTTAGTFIVQFNEAEAYIGKSDLREDGTAYYELEQGGGDILSASANATISFKDGKCEFTVFGTVEVEDLDEPYTTRVELRLIQA